MIKGMYDYSHSNSTLNVKGYKNSQGNRGFWEKKITPWASQGKLHLRLPPTAGIADGLSLASPCLGMPWVRLKLSAFLRNLRNLSRELLLFITFSRVLYLHVLSCRQSLSPAIQKSSIPVAQIKLHCFSSQLSQFLTERDQTRSCQFMSTTEGADCY